MKSLDSTTPNPEFVVRSGLWLGVYWVVPLLPIPFSLIIVSFTLEALQDGLFLSALLMIGFSGTPRKFVFEPDALVVYWRFYVKRYEYACMRIEDRKYSWHYTFFEWRSGSSNLVLVHPDLWPSLTLQYDGADVFDEALLEELYSRIPLAVGGEKQKPMTRAQRKAYDKRMKANWAKGNDARK